MGVRWGGRVLAAGMASLAFAGAVGAALERPEHRGHSARREEIVLESQTIRAGRFEL